MSSILKALKKLEDEKVSRQPDELKIDSEILRTDNPPVFSGVALLLSSLLLLIGGSGATYMYMKLEKPPESTNLKLPTVMIKQNQPMVTNTEPNIKTEPVTKGVPPPAKKEESIKTTPPVKKQLPVPAPVAKAPVAMGIKPAKTGIELKPVVPIAIKTTENGNKILTPIIPVPDKTMPPLLRVNGIAYQNNSAESMAIINGNPLSKGSVIEGVTIEEIHRDKVVFQHNGRKFEIPLGQTNR